ncbi:MAG: hypothetical protein ACT4NL_13565 [Pseudomarimonas sp.]
MKVTRVVFWLLLLPGLLIYLALKLNTHLAKVADGVLEEREREQRLAAIDAENQRQEAINLDAQLQARRALANSCVNRALQTIGGQSSAAPATLVIVNYKGCGVDCDTDLIASGLVDEYVLNRLQVLLIRTVEAGQSTTPLGVHTVVITDCAPLAADHGDDFFFRDGKGVLSSSGERHEGYLTSRKGLDTPFDPEPLARKGLGLPPRR